MKKFWLVVVFVLIGGVLMAEALTGDYALPVQTQLVNQGLSGWVEDARTWTFSGDNDPEFTATVGEDITGEFSVGMRLRLKQDAGTYVYFIITKMAYSAPNTTVTLYGGTDYNLANETITDVALSPVKAPYGFPLSPDKWTVEVVDTSTRTQAAPSSGTWYNIGTTNSQISIPTGIWNVSYQVFGGADLNSLTTNISITLSTANNSESNTHMTAAINIGNSSVSVLIESRLVASDVISLSSETLFYLNAKTGTSGVPNLYFGGATIPTIIRAVCAYL